MWVYGPTTTWLGSMAAVSKSGDAYKQPYFVIKYIFMTFLLFFSVKRHDIFSVSMAILNVMSNAGAHTNNIFSFNMNFDDILYFSQTKQVINSRFQCVKITNVLRRINVEEERVYRFLYGHAVGTEPAGIS